MDKNKTPDLLDIFITKGIPAGHMAVTLNLDLFSDYSPIIATTTSSVLTNRKIPLFITTEQIGAASIIFLNQRLLTVFH